MKLINAGAEIFIPDGTDFDTAMRRAKGGCLAVGAHQDDLEIFAMHGIGKCYGRKDQMFVGITVTDGGNSARKGKYASLSDEQMIAKRHAEQNQAAKEGGYAAQFQLHYKSRDIKGAKPAKGDALVEEIHQILLHAAPNVIYAHNPFDKHDTHCAVLRATIKALRKLPAARQPKEVYGCEVWRGLDWVPDGKKVALDVSGHKSLQAKLIACHDSQIAGSKNYIEATLGRETANATYSDFNALDATEAVIYAVDLMPLLKDPQMTLQDFTSGFTSSFSEALRSSAEIYEF
jgi:LmbE family N-acetylglucosaminyl deacetylase